jgi:hypothetical protein
MTGFESWRSPEGGETLPQAGLASLPPRKAPSSMDQLRESARQTASDYTSMAGKVTVTSSFDDFLAERTDSPYYLGLCGRAAICLRLTPAYISSLNELIPVATDGAKLYVHPYTERYPILRTVLTLPTAEPLEFESPLLLTNGDVQDFVTAVLQSEIVELHIGATGTDRSLSMAFRAHRIRDILGGAISCLMAFEHPPDDDRIRAAVNQMAVDFPRVTDGLSPDSLVTLEPQAPATNFVVYEEPYSGGPQTNPA